MGLFDLMKPRYIGEGVKTCKATAGAVLLDVRETDEYAAGHIPGSVNLPLSAISAASKRVPTKDTPLFVYCLSGNRSGSAVGALKSMGYTNVTNIGGIRSWRGEIER